MVGLRTMNTSGKAGKRKKERSFAGFARFLVIALAVAGATVYRAYLVNRTEALNREVVRHQKQIFDLRREIEHCRIKRESLSDWKHVRAKIREFGLPLRAAEPRQVRALDAKRDKGRMVAAVNHRDAAVNR